MADETRAAFKCRIHRGAYRNRERSEVRKAANTARTIGVVRARCKIGMTNLARRIRRFVCTPFARGDARQAWRETANRRFDNAAT